MGNELSALAASQWLGDGDLDAELIGARCGVPLPMHSTPGACRL